MRILIINPNSDQHTNDLMAATARRISAGAHEVDVVRVEQAPKLVSSYLDYAKSTDAMIEIVRESGGKYDAYVVACHSDPNLDLMKEIAGKPVVGIAEASMHFAMMAGNGFAVISPSPKSISKKFALARKYHCQELLRTIKVSGGDDRQSLLAACKEAAAEPCVDAIVLGCANYTGADGWLEQQLGLPVFDGVACALLLAAGLVGYGKYKSEKER